MISSHPVECTDKESYTEPVKKLKLEAAAKGLVEFLQEQPSRELRGVHLVHFYKRSPEHKDAVQSASVKGKRKGVTSLCDMFADKLAYRVVAQDNGPLTDILITCASHTFEAAANGLVEFLQGQPSRELRGVDLRRFYKWSPESKDVVQSASVKGKRKGVTSLCDMFADKLAYRVVAQDNGPLTDILITCASDQAPWWDPLTLQHSRSEMNIACKEHDVHKALCKLEETNEEHDVHKALCKLEETNEEHDVHKALCKLEETNEEHDVHKALCKLEETNEEHDVHKALCKLEETNEKTNEEHDVHTSLCKLEETNEERCAPPSGAPREGAPFRLELSATARRLMGLDEGAKCRLLRDIWSAMADAAERHTTDHGDA
jgi:hypothetical protein